MDLLIHLLHLQLLISQMLQFFLQNPLRKKPVVIESADGSDSIAIRNTGVLSLTWDHRVFDGSTALLFLNSIKDKLENHPWADDLN